MLRRRGVLGALIGIIAAPALVRAESLMPVVAIPTPPKIITPSEVVYRVTGVDQFGRRVVEDIIGVLSGFDSRISTATKPFAKITSVRVVDQARFSRKYGAQEVASVVTYHGADPRWGLGRSLFKTARIAALAGWRSP